MHLAPPAHLAIEGEPHRLDMHQGAHMGATGSIQELQRFLPGLASQQHGTSSSQQQAASAALEMRALSVDVLT